MARFTSLYRPVGLVTVTAAVVLAGNHLLTSHDTVDAQPMLDASVTIRTVSHVHIDRLGDSVWGAGSGSGFLVDANTCEVWTNHHVVENAAIIRVFARGVGAPGTGIPARVINSTPRGDLAILSMDRCDGIRVATLGDSDDLHPGEDTYAVGNPLGNNPDSISRGIISHTERYVAASTIAYLQTDAPINRGNSGGALFNRDGEVVGINTAIASGGNGGNIGIGYALPVNVARQLVADLHDGPPRWGDAGLDGLISPLHPDEAIIFGAPEGRGAVIVTRDPTKGPVAGVLQQHDVIHRIGQVEVAAIAEALRVVSEHQPGESLDIDVVRGGKPVTVQVTLDDGWVSREAPQADPYQGYLGMTLETWNDRDGEEGQFTRPVITRVQSLGPAHRALIASSQRAYAANGPFLSEYRLDVKTVTGVVLDGKYHGVETPADLDGFAEAAFREGKSLLLEIEHWVRENPMNPGTSLTHAGTAFFKVNPRPAPSPLMMAELDGGR